MQTTKLLQQLNKVIPYIKKHPSSLTVTAIYLSSTSFLLYGATKIFRLEAPNPFTPAETTGLMLMIMAVMLVQSGAAVLEMIKEGENKHAKTTSKS